MTRERCRFSVIATPFINDLAMYMKTGGVIHVQSDVEAVADDAVEKFAESPYFDRVVPDPSTPPFGIM